MTFTMRKALIAIVPLVTLAGCASYEHEHRAYYDGSRSRVVALKSDAAEDLRIAMRKLWEDHITFTRNYIISALGNLPDASSVLTRLMQNQEDIGNAVKPYYGDAAGRRLTGLLKEHIAIAGDVVTAARSGDPGQLDMQQRRWSDNGRQIAAFLASANPNWNRADLESMMQRHLDLTTGEVVGRLRGDWNGDIRSYDAGHQHMLMFADALTDGIAKQFPQRFTAVASRY